MVKRLDTYVWRELFIPFLIGAIAIALMFSINQLMYILENVSLQNVPREAIFLDLLYKLPFWLKPTLPMGVALAASLAFTRLARESELTAMRAAGTPIMRIIRPVAIFGVVVALGSFFMMEKIMPKTELKSAEIERKVGVLGVLPQFKSNAVVYLRDYSASFGTVSRSGDALQITNLVLFRRQRADETEIIAADSGTYNDGIWTLHQPYGWTLDGLTLTGFKPQSKDMIIDQRIVVEDLYLPRTEDTQTASELLAAIRDGKKTGLDTRELQVAFHNRFSVPAACIIFAMVAPIFAILFARTGGFAGVLLSIFLVMLYYNVYMVCTQIIGKNGWLPPFAAAWLPIALFGAIGFFGLRRLG